MRKRIWLGIILSFFAVNIFAGEKKIIGVWMCPGGPWGIWEKSYNGDPFPVKMIVKDLADLGVNEIYFFEQSGRGGTFFHPTKVKNAVIEPRMKGRDFLKELLEETEKYNIDVWLTWTTPSEETRARNKGAGMYAVDIGLNSAELRKIYKDLIAEVRQDYGTKYKSLKGILWHELDCSEALDNHADDLEEFKVFCKKRFKEEYKGAGMPEVNAKDKWWRRYVLYKNDIMNSFMKEMSEEAKKYNLETAFCFYTPESYSGESWKWGYDGLALERICDVIWIPGYTDTAKPYHSFKGVRVDFGLSYKGQNLPKNYSYAFHGCPVSWFEYRTPLYLKEMREYYSSNKSFTEKHGDFYTGYVGHNEKELSLFFGKENMKNWLGLMSSWQPGETPASISVAINPNPFVMLYPYGPGIEYNKKVVSLMESMSSYIDIDGMVSGSLNMKENLKKYKLVIIPEDMGTGLSKEVYQQYVSYVKGGGKLFVINTSISTGREDLTEIEDKTGEMCGIRIKGKNQPGFLMMGSNNSIITLPEKKFWADTSQIEAGRAEVIVKDKNTGTAILTRNKIGNGEVWFSGIGFNPDISEYFASIIKAGVSSPINLEGSVGMRILETTKKGNAVCIALWGKGTSTLKVDTKEIGLRGADLIVKDIVTGKVIKEGATSKDLLQGVPLEIKYLNQPYIVAIGTKEELKGYQGIYGSEDVFEGMAEQRIIENPEVPIMVPAGEGIKVGVYHGGSGTEGIMKALGKAGFRVFSLPRIDRQALSYGDVIIIPQGGSTKMINQAVEDIRKYVEEGGGVLLTHDAVGYRKYQVLFPEIGKGITNPKLDILKVVKEHPITQGFKVGDTFTPGFRYDHILIEKGVSGEILIENERGEGVVVVGKVGKGKVVLNGMLPGVAGEKTDGGGKEKEPEGAELKILINTVKWLGEK